LKEITTLIFDFGCVITLPQNEGAISRICAAINGARGAVAAFPRQTILDLYNEYRDEYDRGALNAEQYWGSLLGRLAVSPTAALMRTLIDADVDCWFHFDPEMLAFIEEKRAEAKHIALLSNINFEGVAQLKAKAKWLSLFDVTVLSCEHLLLKPQPEIYQLCLDRLGESAQSCLFVDDRAVNAEGARKVGLNAHVYSGLAGLKEDIAHNYHITK
jgi:putative hydrolase of the HAD superfamily